MSGSLVANEISTELRRAIAARLPAFLARQRWFGGKARRISSTNIVDAISFENFLPGAIMLIVRVSYGDGGAETYSLPFLCGAPDSAVDSGEAVLLLGDSRSVNRAFVLSDALANEQFATLLLRAMQQRIEFSGEQGRLTAFQTEAFANASKGRDPSARLTASKLAATDDENSGALKPKVLTGEQSNTSVIYGHSLILKFFRRLEEGVNPDLEIGRFLTGKAHYKNTPQTLAWLEYGASGKASTQAILQALVPNQGDAWRHTLKTVSRFYELAAKHPEAKPANAATRRDNQENAQIPDFARASVAPDLQMVALLGRRTGELHLALASELRDPSFAPEPFKAEFQHALQEETLQLASATLRQLQERSGSLRSAWGEQAQAIVSREHEITHRIQSLLSEPIHAMRIRIHGDYHLGQVLCTGSDFVIIDFEGEPARPLAERRIKRSPLQDVAGMLRSFHYAAYAPLLGVAGENGTRTVDASCMSAWAECWYSWVSSRFLNEYLMTSQQAPYLPADSSELQRLLELHLLEKALYELGYELNNRPEWVGIPLQGIVTLLSV